MADIPIYDRVQEPGGLPDLSYDQGEKVSTGQENWGNGIREVVTLGTADMGANFRAQYTTPVGDFVQYKFKMLVSLDGTVTFMNDLVNTKNAVNSGPLMKLPQSLRPRHQVYLPVVFRNGGDALANSMLGWVRVQDNGYVYFGMTSTNGGYSNTVPAKGIVRLNGLSYSIADKTYF